MYALADCNNFYVSCERLFRPGLNGKPVVVLSNNDGCVIARSEEAKALGIPMGAPAFSYRALFRRHGVSVCSSNYALYGDMSARVMRYLGEAAPETEIYSIDEAFMHFGNCLKTDYRQVGLALREKILRGTGIPVSIGFAGSKTLAKAANRIAKKYPGRTGNICCLDTSEKINKTLVWLKTADIWGIGGALSSMLERHGVHTAFEFTRMNDAWIRKHCQLPGLRLKYELLGRPVTGLETPKDKKHMACTRSFENSLGVFRDVLERVSTYAWVCSEKLRAQDSDCNTLLVFLHTDEHRQDQPQYSRNIVLHLPFACNSGIELAGFAEKGLRCIYKEGYLYKKAGVIAMDLSPACKRQQTLFQNRNSRHPALMQAMDKINGNLGRHKVRLAVQAPGKTWKMRQEHLSPAYTTKLKDIITIYT